MKLLWKLSREAVRYKHLYALAILATMGLTVVNLAAPRVLSAMTGIVERGMVAFGHWMVDRHPCGAIPCAGVVPVFEQLFGP